MKFGLNSAKKLRSCHPDIQAIMNLAIKRTDIDFGISEGHRSMKRQKELFNMGKSKVRRGKHNESPSMAVDVYAYHPDLETRRRLAYDKVHLAYLGGLFTSIAKELKELGIITHDVRWGANWDRDGVIDFDQDFDDYPHLELI